MYLDFIDEKYKKIALSMKKVSYETDITSSDAFLIVLNGLDYETIDNLCKKLAVKLSIDEQEVYKLIQNKNIDDDFKEILLITAYEIIHANEKLGNKIVNNHNTSSWIMHSLYEGEIASSLAKKMGLDSDTAMKIGLLHDIGRKFDQSFRHTIKGFEYLIDNGLVNEAFSTLTHSFLSSPEGGKNIGNRCANCESSIEGFYIDELGRGVFRKGSRVDDVTVFLENYEYNPYDIILNISDLMATSTGITSPYDRMLDVYTRKIPDPNNSPFFKVCFINALNRLLYSITKDESYDLEVNIRNFDSLEEIDKMLINTSNSFLEGINKDINEFEHTQR